MKVLAAIKVGLRTAPRRSLAIASVVISSAIAVAVLVAMLSVSMSFAKTASRVDDPRRRIVEQVGVDSEGGNGALGREVADLVIGHLDVQQDEHGERLFSKEVTRAILVQNARTGENVFATLRGVGPSILRVRKEMHLLNGRFPLGGNHEVMVGRALASRLGGVRVGSDLETPNGRWAVVGIFASSGDSHESELIADSNDVMDALRIREYSSIVYIPNSTESEPTKLTETLQRDGFPVQINTEAYVMKRVYQQITELLFSIAYSLTAIIATALLIGILNTFLITVRKRTEELATLRALGFARSALTISIVAEAIACGLTGALLGTAIVWLFEGTQLSLYSGFSAQISFELHVGTALAFAAIGATATLALLVGVIGAAQVFSVPPATALRRI